MITKIIFNTDKKLKSAAQKKARAQGMTLSAVLNILIRAYINGTFKIGIIKADFRDSPALSETH